jgi:hypothetical protein
MHHRSVLLINEINVTGFLIIMVALLAMFMVDSLPHAHYSHPSVDSVLAVIKVLQSEKSGSVVFLIDEHKHLF